MRPGHYGRDIRTASLSVSEQKLQRYIPYIERRLRCVADQDRDRAFYWFRNAPIPEFGHRTAKQLVADHKTDAVLAYLQSIRGGSSR